jgi:hypothetical protein
VSTVTNHTRTLTLGSAWLASAHLTDELRFNYSHVNDVSAATIDGFGGAVPITSFPFPQGYSTQNAYLYINVRSLTGSYQDGLGVNNTQRQYNIVDSVSLQHGHHDIKLGADLRYLAPIYMPESYSQQAYFATVAAAKTGTIQLVSLTAPQTGHFLFPDLGFYAQDTWKMTSRLTMTYGLRWDIEPPPSTLSGPSLPAFTGVDHNNMSDVALAPAGTPPFHTQWGNLAPRFGLVYQLSAAPGWGTVLRAGTGVFYDMATSEIGNLFTSTYPYTARASIRSGTYPLPTASVAAPVVTPAVLTTTGTDGTDPNLNLPYTIQWNVALQQSLGAQQTFTLTYVGSAGRRLLESLEMLAPNSNFYAVDLTTNGSTSDCRSFRVHIRFQLQRGERMFHEPPQRGA